QRERPDDDARGERSRERPCGRSVEPECETRPAESAGEGDRGGHQECPPEPSHVRRYPWMESGPLAKLGEPRPQLVGPVVEGVLDVGPLADAAPERLRA